MVCSLFALVNRFSWKLWELDVKDLFFNGEIDKNIYMDQQSRFDPRLLINNLFHIISLLYVDNMIITRKNNM